MTKKPRISGVSECPECEAETEVTECADHAGCPKCTVCGYCDICALPNDYNPSTFDCSGVVDAFGQVHSDADPGL